MCTCPKCGSIMKFNINYSCGIPNVWYTCITCGFDSSNDQIIYTSTTTYTDDITNLMNTKRSI